LGAYRIAGTVKGERIVSKKLFVGSLSWNTTDEGLRRAFEKFGEVLEAKVIKDRETDRSRGFGFVSFANPKDAMDAMQAMDGQELDGRTIKVNEAQERERSGGGPRGGGFSRGGGGGERRGGERRSGGGGRW
jgi:cold-inducible RNA-binding protein